MSNSLDLGLIKMNNEVLALKTSHRKGLGSFTFNPYRYDVPRGDIPPTESEWGYYLAQVTITFDSDAPFPPLWREYDTVGGGVTDIVINASNRTILFKIGFIQDGTITSATYYFVSSSAISNVQVVKL